MTTRLYFGNGAPPVSPTFDASWEATGSAVRRNLEPFKDTPSAAFESLAVATALNSPAGAVDVLIAQYVSDPLNGNQTISGAIKGQVRALESATAGDLRMQCVIWVRKTDGTSRGTLVASDASALASEFPITTATNREVPLGSPVTPASVAALDTDRIVVEVGYRKHENATTSRTGTLRLGNPTGTDLAEDESTTTDNVPWIEFADTLTFTSDYARVTQVAVEVLDQSTVVQARVTQIAVEVLDQSTVVQVRVTQLAVEVLHANVTPPQPMSVGIIG